MATELLRIPFAGTFHSDLSPCQGTVLHRLMDSEETLMSKNLLFWASLWPENGLSTTTINKIMTPEENVSSSNIRPSVEALWWYPYPTRSRKRLNINLLGDRFCDYWGKINLLEHTPSFYCELRVSSPNGQIESCFWKESPWCSSLERRWVWVEGQSSGILEQD